MKRREKNTKKVMCLFFAAFLFLCLTASLGMAFYSYHNRIPSNLYFWTEDEQKIDFNLPGTGMIRAAASGQKSNIPRGAVTIDLSGPVTMKTGGQDQYDMEVRLFGFLPIKNVNINIIENRQLIPMGTPVGIYMKSKGVMVIGVAEFTDEDGQVAAPAKNLLHSGDYVLSVNGVAVMDKEGLMEAIASSEGNPQNLKIERDGEITEVVIFPKKNACGQYKAGIWVRDNLQGVGTLTYLDGNGNFGALGHGIADADTDQVVEIESGVLYQTKIVNMRKGENGNPGEMTGRIIYDDQYILGEIQSNNAKGVFGHYYEGLLEMAQQEAVPIGLKQEIEVGPAQILCTIDGTPESFQVEITKVHLEHDNVNRGIELKVTDQKLLECTGGIIQGMSGSPILQNGKIIGAVTHVLVNSPERGYGIFIENMLEETRDGSMN